MRSLIVGLLVFFAVSIDVNARGIPAIQVESLFYADVGIFSSEKTLPEAEGVVLRWGRTYWPLSKFVKCFVELSTPMETRRNKGEGRWSWPRVKWQGKEYGAYCLDSSVEWYRIVH